MRNIVSARTLYAHLAVIVPAIIIVAATHRGIYVDGFIDVNLDPVRELRFLEYAWNSTGFLFGTNTGFWQSSFFVTAAYAILMGLFKLSLAVAERVWLFLIVALCGYSIQYLIRTLFPELKSALLIAPAFFVLNVPFFTSLKEGSTYALTSYAALPLEIGLLVYAARGRDLYRSAFMIGLISALLANSNPPLNVMNDAVLVFALVMMIGFRSAPLRRLLTLGIVLSGLLVLMSLWWLLPFATFMHGYYLPAFNAEGVTLQSQASNFSNEIRGLGLWAFGASPEIAGDAYFGFATPYLTNPLVIMSSFVPAAFAIAGLLFGRLRSRSSVVAFSLMGVLAIILASASYSGGAGAFSNWSAPAYNFLYQHVPLFAIFRASYKWQALVQLWIAVVGSGCVGVLATADYRNKRWLRILRPLPYLSVACMCAPILFLGIFTPEQLISGIPGYWNEAASFVRANTSATSRFFVLPEQGFANYTWGQARGDIVTPLFDRSAVADFLGPARSREVSKLAHFAFSQNTWGQDDNTLLSLLRTTSTSHTLERYDFDWQANGINGSPVFQSFELSRLPVDAPVRFGALTIRRLKNSTPMIYTTDHAAVVSGESDYQTLLQLGVPQSAAVVDAGGIGTLQEEVVSGRAARSALLKLVPSGDDYASSLAIASSGAALCTAAESQLFLKAGAYTLALQDRTLGQVAHTAQIGVTIDGTALAPTGFVRRYGDYLDLGERTISEGEHTCKLQAANPSDDVRMFFIPTERLRVASGQMDRLPAAGVVASFDENSSQRHVNFSVTQPGRYAVQVKTEVVPSQTGTAQVLGTASEVLRSNAIPGIFGEGFSSNRPGYTGFQQGLPAYLTTELQSYHWLGTRGTIYLYAPKSGPYSLRLHAATLDDHSRLELSYNNNVVLTREMRSRQGFNRRKEPATMGDLGPGEIISSELNLRPGWNRLQLSSTGDLFEIAGTEQPASTAIWSLAVASQGGVTLPAAIGSLASGSVEDPAIRFGNQLPSLRALRMKALKVTELSSLSAQSIQLSSQSAQLGILLGVGSGHQQAPSQWIQIPLSGPGSNLLSGKPVDLSGAIASESLYDPLHATVTAAYLYAFDTGSADGVGALGQPVIQAARPAESIINESQSGWRFSGDARTNYNRLGSDAVTYSSLDSSPVLNAEAQVVANSPLIGSELNVAFATTSPAQPEIAVTYWRNRRRSTYYPGDYYGVDGFVPVPVATSSAIYSGRLPPGFAPQFDETGSPKAMWFLRDGVPLTFVSGTPSAGQWSLESGVTGWTVLLDGRDVSSGAGRYRLVVQPSQWFASDGAMITARVPGESFRNLPLPVHSFNVSLKFRGVASANYLLTMKDAQLVESAPISRIVRKVPRIAIDGKAVPAADTVVSLRAGLHTLTLLSPPVASRREVMLVEPAEFAHHIETPIEVNYSKPTDIQIHLPQAKTNSRVLVFSQTYDSDWVAIGGGAPLPHFRVNYAFNGFIVPAGIENVQLQYRGPSVLLLVGRIASVLTLMALAGLAVLERRGRGR